MPQFNPDDRSLPNNGIPKRLLEIFGEGSLPGEARELAAVIFSKLPAIIRTAHPQETIPLRQLFTASEWAQTASSVAQLLTGMSALARAVSAGEPLVRI